ncbi:hypothetical protein IQ227_15550 [Anabaena aphanizomenioides LEGE 00250]|jgi:hypothetical protein|uniref:Transposase n=1 Tax=Sphaerospermopsis aphanizomenoides LEGE 00250 TaxID=2777972 RepID=A0ABR9VFY6_9CYAN|nr:hypothetical protein [Sphaerospermopsis aphanizomenoides]MBE9237404.1 hypothetical protein [Sphaerospermopsis aphanizomenoides LEGE 00250]
MTNINILYLSESGCPGFEDLQDVIDKLFVRIFEILVSRRDAKKQRRKEEIV